MGKIKILFGPGGAGKDTVIEYILKHNFLKDKYVTDIKQYTTRSRRVNDSDDDRHVFITKDEYDELVKNELAFACEKHNNYEGDVYYCYNAEDFKDLHKNYLVYGVSLCVVEGFIERFGRSMVDPIYITASDYIRLNRMINRESDGLVIPVSDAVVRNACHRIISDYHQYKGDGRLRDVGVDITNTIMNTGPIEEAAIKVLNLL